jgi:hypothetical protein
MFLGLRAELDLLNKQKRMWKRAPKVKAAACFENKFQSWKMNSKIVIFKIE